MVDIGIRLKGDIMANENNIITTPASSLGIRVAMEDTSLDVVIEGGTAISRRDDQVLEAEFNGDWDQYQEVLKNSTIKGLWNKRLTRLTGTSGEWHLAGDFSDTERSEVLNTMKEMLGRMQDFNSSYSATLEAIILGYKASELVWKIDPNRQIWWIDQWLTIPNRLTAFDQATNDLLFRNSVSTGQYKIVPELLKFPVLSYHAKDGKRYGQGLGESLFFFQWAQREAFKNWFTYTSRYSHPIPKAKVPAATTKQQKSEVRQDLKSLYTNNVIVHRDDVEISFIEPDRRDAGQAFQTFNNAIKTEMALILEGQAITQDQLSGTGSFASHSVADRASIRLTQDDAKAGDQVITKIGRWFALVNFGEKIANALWYRTAIDEDELSREKHSEIIERLSNSVDELPLSKSWLLDRFDLRAPDQDAEDDEIIIGKKGSQIQQGQFAETDEKKKKLDPYLNG